MIRWLNKRARCTCLFAVLLAALAGCNGDDAKTPQQQGTFETTPQDESVPDQANIPEVPAAPASQEGQATFVADQAGIPQEPVIGTVTPVPGTEPSPPVTTGGEAIPLTRESEPVPPGPVAIVPPVADRQIVLPRPEPVVPPIVVPEKITRFTEIAPDTIGGATYISSPALEYDLGNLIAASAGETYAVRDDDRLFITPIRGWLRFPEKVSSQKIQRWGRFPIIVFLHGNHSTSVKNYQGYDYLAEELASHGYVVLSIDANVNNDVGDRQSQSRGQLILGTLDRLRQIDEQGQVNLDGTPGALDALKDKLDFSRVGIMGHSRGGQGVSNAIKFNLTRAGVNPEELEAALKNNPKEFERNYPDLANAVTPATTAEPAVNDKAAAAARQATINADKLKAAITKYNLYFAAGRETAEPYDFKGAFMLAPTDYSSNLGINNVPLAVLLPSCDGDVHNLAGARIYDHNRFGPITDTAPRYQILVHGANHNFYNTIWTDDDSSRDVSYCAPGRVDTIRLSEKEQQRNGAFIINSFMRYHVGGEQKFAAYWNATAQLPKAACPLTDEHCNRRVILTLQKNPARSKLIQRFQAGDSLDRNALDGSIKLAGFDEHARCTMAFDGTNPDSAIEPGTCSPARLNGFQYRTRYLNSMRSISDHLELAWSKPTPSIALDLIEISTKSYDSLTFRIAVVQPIGQEVQVTLTDNTGRMETLAASEYSDALYNVVPPKSAGSPAKDDVKDALFVDKMQPLMNMVAIPLNAFEGVDLTRLKELKLTFPKASGKVAITDIELQNLGRAKPAATVAVRQ